MIVSRKDKTDCPAILNFYGGNIMKSDFTSRLKYGVSAFAVAAMLPISIQASYAAEDAAAEEDVTFEEVVVTGSRIIRKNLVTASPVTTMDAAEITFSGTTRIEDLLNTLPQTFNAQNSTVANGATGTATVNLRGLGSSRTLVLLNGRRMQPGDPLSPSTDLNFIPSALVKRVDILTGGASSVYGSDAVAGVVNFILDTDFEGVRADAQYSFYQHNNRNKAIQDINRAKNFDVPSGSITDGGAWNLSLALGGSFADDRGHASAYLSYRQINNIPKSNRDYSNCALTATTGGTVCGGSSTTPWGTFWTDNADYLVDPVTGDFIERNGEVFNYGPYNFYQRDDKNYTGGAFINYEVNDYIEVYTEFMFMDDRTNAQIAPSGNFYRTNSINCDNPMLSPEQVAIICTAFGKSGSESATLWMGRRNVEGGPRNADIRHTAYRMVTGFKGDLDDNWSYDVYGMYGSSIYQEAYTNDLNVTRIRRALDVIVDPDTGLPACRTAIDGTDPSCVPWNVFKKDGVTQAAVDYITGIGIAKGETKTQIVSGSLSGSLEEYGLKFPGAEEGVSVAIGAEYRKETSEFTPDESFSMGLLAGQGGATQAVGGSFDVKEFFGEAVIPLVQNAEFAKELSLELGYRYSDYSTAGSTNTFKVAGTWTPINDIRFRAGFNRAVRAPNILNLFSPQRFGLGGSEDICAGDAVNGLVNGFTAAQCANTGVTAAQFGNIPGNPADQYNTFGGGNPNLLPETANTITIGVVIAPEAVPGLNISVDWFDIKITNTIGALGADDIITTCANTGDAQLCGLINRDSSGTLWRSDQGFTVTTSQNIGQLRTQGVDVNASYSADIEDNGMLDFNLIGTYMIKSEFENPLTSYDCTGLFGNQCGTPTAEWRHRFRTAWVTPFDLTVSATWRYIGSVMNDDSSANPNLANAGNQEKWEASGVWKIGARSYFDLALMYPATEEIEVTVGVNNVFDKEPALFPSISDTSYQGTYDPLGRYIFFGVQTNF